MKVLSRFPLWRLVARLAGRLLFRWAENNEDDRQDKNGERWLMRELVRSHAACRPGEAFVAIDCGANAGLYARALVNEAGTVGCPIELHLFEPSPTQAEALRRDFLGMKGIRVEEAAVSDSSGRALLFSGRCGSGHASLVSRPGEAAQADEAVQVSLLPLSDYLQRQIRGSVHLLKLDIEGSELAALRGLGAHLSPGSVEFIQFEYGGTTIDAGNTLRDFFELLEGRGYRVAKLLPKALEVRRYRPWMDNQSYANYVALGRDRTRSVGTET